MLYVCISCIIRLAVCDCLCQSCNKETIIVIIISVGPVAECKMIAVNRLVKENNSDSSTSSSIV